MLSAARRSRRGAAADPEVLSQGMWVSQTLSAQSSKSAKIVKSAKGAKIVIFCAPARA